VDKIFEEILIFSLTKKLFCKNQCIGIAVSGGSDSVALLHFFYHIKSDFNLDLIVLHFNHKIRQDSDDDEKFVESLAKSYGIKFYTESKNVYEISKKNKKSLEEQARLLRYGFFEQCRKKFNLDKIAIAHTKNDLVETFFINLLRGSSLDGLVSLKPHRDFYIRPMLCIEKSQIISFLNEHNLKYKTDSTNFDTYYTRNRVRLELLELLKNYNPNIVSTLFNTIELLGYDSCLLNKLSYENFIESTSFSSNKAFINTQTLSKNYSIKSRVIKMTLKKLLDTNYSLSSININRIVDAIDSKRTVFLRKLLKAYKTDNFFIIERL